MYHICYLLFGGGGGDGGLVPIFYIQFRITSNLILLIVKLPSKDFCTRFSKQVLLFEMCSFRNSKIELQCGPKSVEHSVSPKHCTHFKFHVAAFCYKAEYIEMLSCFLPALVTFTELVVVLRAYTSFYTAWPENLSRTQKQNKKRFHSWVI